MQTTSPCRRRVPRVAAPFPALLAVCLAALPLALLPALGPAPQAQDEAAPRPVITRIDPQRALYAPTQVVWTPAHGFVALATDGESRQLVLYRAADPGDRWHRWRELALTAAHGDVELVADGDRVLLFGARGERILILSLALADSAAEGAPRDGYQEMTAGAPVMALSADCSPPDSTGARVAHLAYLLRATAETGRSILYRRSVDGGMTWSPADTLAQGDVDGLHLFAHSDRGNLVDLAYRQGRFMAWRGSGSRGRSWSPEIPIRLAAAPGSHNAVARRGSQVLVICENEFHQVAGATSLNHGYNWERAIAIAREGRHVRMPALDCGGGLFWIAYSAADSLVVLRSAVRTSFPKQWHRGINVAEVCTQGQPDVVALPGGAAGLIYGTPAGEVYFARARRPVER